MSITCRECKERIYPEDPTIRQPRWIGRKIIPYGSPSSCDAFCDKPSYEREIEARLDEPREVVHKHFHSDLSKEHWDRVEQSLRDNADLRKKVNELYEKRKGVEYEIKG